MQLQKYNYYFKSIRLENSAKTKEQYKSKINTHSPSLSQMNKKKNDNERTIKANF